MKKVFLYLLFGMLFLFSACSQTTNQDIVNENKEVNESLVQSNTPNEPSINLTKLKSDQLKNINIDLDISYTKLRDIYGKYTMDCGLIDSPYFDFSEEDKKNCEELFTKMEKAKAEYDNLEIQKQKLETNTKGIITYSDEITTEMPLELLNLNPSILRFDLSKDSSLKIFIVDNNYECLFSEGNYGKGTQIIENSNNCYINTSKSLKVIVESENKIKPYSILPEFKYFGLYTDKKITGVTFPNGADSNVTWEIDTTLENPSPNTYLIHNLRAWVTNRDSNLSAKDPNAIDRDPISNELLLREFEIKDLKLLPGQKIEDRWSFNYSDIPSPVVWFDYDYYYEIK